jgi:ABC-type Na+ efflux pump permease subunit
MTNWVKLLAPSIVGLLAVVLILMFSGLATSTILNSENQYVTQTVVGLDVNVFAAVMILGVFLSVLVTSFVVNRK